MASAKAIKKLDALIWALIFGGLLTFALGLATHGSHVIAGWSLTALGGLAAGAGVALIWVRSRMHESTIDQENQ